MNLSRYRPGTSGSGFGTGGGGNGGASTTVTGGKYGRRYSWICDKTYRCKINQLSLQLDSHTWQHFEILVSLASHLRIGGQLFQYVKHFFFWIDKSLDNMVNLLILPRQPMDRPIICVNVSFRAIIGYPVVNLLSCLCYISFLSFPQTVKWHTLSDIPIIVNIADRMRYPWIFKHTYF